MWEQFYSHVIILILIYVFNVSCEEKGSLTFVIDNALKYNDLMYIRQTANEITQLISEDKSRQIKNMVLVTFNEPYSSVTLEIVTENFNEFKNVINNTNVHKEREYSRPTMNGILTGLGHSLPGSFIYVFTDTTTVNNNERNVEVINMCQKKQSQIIFVLVPGQYNSRNNLYSEIATACSGFVLVLRRNAIGQAQQLISETMSGRQTVLSAFKPFPGEYVTIRFEIDDQIEYAIVAVSGFDVRYINFDGPKVTKQKLIWLDNAKSIKLINPPPGQYTARVGSDREIFVYIVGRTDFTFSHGFSKLEPKTINDTTKQPIANTSFHLSILVTDQNHTVNIVSAQIWDMRQKYLYITLPLKKVAIDFYTSVSFVVPSKRFKVAVLGTTSNGKRIRRIAKIPITPSDPRIAQPLPKAPLVTISEGSQTKVEYGKTVKLTCIVSAYPYPTITWKSSNGTTLKSEIVIVDFSYYLISNVTISDVTKDDSYTCYVVSEGHQPEHRTIEVNVILPFDIKYAVKDTTELQYDKKGTLKCDIRAAIPIHIYWSYEESEGKNSTQLVTSDKYTVSENGTQLDINRMDLDMVGKYSCTAFVDNDPETLITFDTQVKATGLERPVVTKINIEKEVSCGSTVDIKCYITGVPTPTITWEFMAKDDSRFVTIPGFDNVLRIENVSAKHAGYYKCVAHNIIGEGEHTVQLTVKVPPKITSGTFVFNGVEGKDGILRIPCIATGLPKPVISWTINGAIITPSSKYVFEDDVLVINDLKINDSQKYTCEAKNDAGSAYEVFQAEILQTPKISGETEKIVKIGDTVEINCTVIKGVPKPSVTLKFMAKDDTKFISVPEFNNVLSISSVDRKHDGRYKCIAHNSLGDNEHIITLTVQEAPKVSGETEKTVKTGDTVEIKCTIENGVPRPNVTWKFMPKDDTEFISVSGSDNVLSISSVDREHDGRYKCIAHNSVGHDEHITTLNVQFAPIITKHAEIYKGLQGHISLRIPCHITGSPKPNIVWETENDIPISDINHHVDLDGALIIKDPKISDSKLYTCNATNYLGSATARYTVEIDGPPEIISNSLAVIKSVEDRDAILRIPCETTGNPKPVITWTLDGVTILPSSKYVFEDSALVIKDPKVHDSHKYKCEAKNYVGLVNKTFQVEILQTPKVTGEIEITVKTGDPVEIKCVIENGVPRPNVTWKFMPKDDTEFISVSGSDNVLSISSVDREHDGRYKCIAHNSVGHDEHITTLNVQFAPIITKHAEIYKGLQGDISLRIPCHITGSPKPNIVWETENDIPISDINLHVDLDGALIIKDPKISDSKSYTCNATNYLGSATAKYTVEIDGPPEIISSSLAVIKSVEDRDTLLRIPCETTGNPKPVITWTLDGVTILPSSKYVLEDSALIIKDPKVHDSHKYKCEAKNYVGLVNKTFQAEILHTPKVTGEIEITVKTGDTVEIKCVVENGVPRPNVTWEFMPKDDTEFISVSGSDNVLSISSVDREHDGRYKCIAHNSVGHDEHITTLNVQFGPIIIKHAEIYKGLQGDISLRIPCHITGSPKPNIVWTTENNIPISAMNLYVDLMDGALIIKDPKISDSKSYTCNATNYLGSAKARYTVEIESPPEIISNSLAIIKSVEDRDTLLRIPCETTGNPKPVITWTLDGVTILPSSKYVFEDSALVIKDPKVHDSHKYKCEAKNYVGSVNKTFQAEILQTPKVTGEKEITVKTGDTVEIKCTIENGVPRPNVTWEFMPKDDTEFISVSGSDNVLSISSVDREHDGRYKCIAHNSVGHDEHITTLNVQFAPIITKQSEIYKGIEGDVGLRIPCHVIGSPKPDIIWEYKVSGSALNKYVDEDSALIIEEPKISDSKSYSCSATNYLGSAEAVYTVKIDDNLEDYGNVSTTVIKNNNTSTNLECIPAKAEQRVRWFKNGIKLNVTTNYINIDIDLTKELIEENINYTCRVSDINGGHTYSYNVEYPPKFLYEQILSVVDMNDGENVFLECDVNANPAANIEWTYSYNENVLKFNKENKLYPDVTNWGQYTCNASNKHGSVQKTVNVLAEKCIIPRKPNSIAVNKMPLILTEKFTWPVLNSNENYLQFEHGNENSAIMFYCPDHEGKKNNFRNFPTLNEISAFCHKPIYFTVNESLYQVSDFECTYEVNPVVVKKEETCLTESSELIRVGYDVFGFLETYAVCFDKSKNMPLYTRVVMSKSNLGQGVTYDWNKYSGIGDGKENNGYTCKSSISSCCYSKTQLVNARDFIDGPAQRSTFIDPLNAVPYWRPCDDGEDPWNIIESSVRLQFLKYDHFIAWSGTHMLQEKNGQTIPRYLWKVLRFSDKESIAIIYVNDKLFLNDDILCKNICPYPYDVPWLSAHVRNIYCCAVNKFLQAFGLSKTTIGKS